jgi:hypothetical protein
MIVLMFRLLSGLIMLLVTSFGLATTEGRLLSQSSSGRTVVFNLGSLDGIRSEDHAVIIKQISDSSSSGLRSLPAARAKIVKTTSTQSILILYQVFDQELLVNGQKYVLLTESNLLKGQNIPSVKRTTIIAPQGEASAIVKSAVADEQDRLAKKADEYQITDRPHEKEFRSDKDFDLIDLEQWEKNKGSRYRTALYKSSNKEEFRKGYRLEAFERIVTAYLARVNDPGFDYDKFYAEQMQEISSNRPKTKSSFNSLYGDFLNKQSQQEVQDAKIYRAILEKGESWSEDFSDEELRKVLNNVSVLQEQGRRKLIASKPLPYNLSFDYGKPSDAQTNADSTYRRNNLSDFAADFEMMPFNKLESLESFTFNFTLRKTNSAFSNEGSNLDFDNLSASLGANWYVFQTPYLIEEPLFFIGTYLRSGLATVSSPVTGQEAKYSAFGFPGFRTGLRYMFKNNVGLRIVASMESLKLERTQANTLGSSLPGSKSLLESKLALGLSFSF